MNLFRFIFTLLFNLCIVSNALALNFSSLHELKLPVPATLAERTLGTSLAMSGSTAAVAAFTNDNAIAGSVYLYAANEHWRLLTELQSGVSADYFAKSIVLVNNILVVSAERDDTQGIDSGAVYIFEQTANAHSNDWRQTAKIMASDAQAGDRFGAGIAFVDDVLYIGAPLRGQGKVYIFTQNRESGRWQNEASVEPQDPQALGFGAAIDQDGQTLVIGAPYTDADNSQLADAKKRQPRFAISKGDTFDPGIESGAIFVYKKIAGQWQATARLGDTIRESAVHVGEAVAVEEDMIGARIKDKDVLDDLRAGVV